VLVGESEGVLRQLIFPRERCPEQRRIIRVQRYHHSLVEIVFDRMLGGRLANSCAQITGNANLNGNLAIRQLFDQISILRGGQTVADALRMKVERSPNGFRRARLPSMGRQAQAMVLSICVGAPKQLGGRFLFISTNADAHDMAIFVADGEFKYFLSLFDSEVAGRVKDPKQGDAEITSAARAPALEPFEDRREVLLSE
jgi:hypothetical protein